MSLVYSYVYCKDKKFYRGLTYRGKLARPAKESLRWFICFDDDDPPELVVEFDSKESVVDATARVKMILTERGFTFHSLEFHGICQRQHDKFRDSKAFFFRLSGPAPIPGSDDQYDAVFDDFPGTEGVYEGIQHEQLNKLTRKLNEARGTQ